MKRCLLILGVLFSLLPLGGQGEVNDMDAFPPLTNIDTDSMALRETPSASPPLAWQLTCAICGQKEECYYCRLVGCLVVHFYDRPAPVVGLDLCDSCREKHGPLLRVAVAQEIAQCRTKEKSRIEARRNEERISRVREINAQLRELQTELEEWKGGPNGKRIEP